jgi:hypothetical protein
VSATRAGPGPGASLHEPSGACAPARTPDAEPEQCLDAVKCRRDRAGAVTAGERREAAVRALLPLDRGARLRQRLLAQVRRQPHAVQLGAVRVHEGARARQRFRHRVRAACAHASSSRPDR